jgi:GTP-binding protein
MPGEEGIFRFEMKFIADVGLVGFPNAGKSTLTNALTNTRRPTGPYPFTTLTPKVGTIGGDRIDGPVTIADIPGLIAGAHANRGLGCRFLRHIERCRILVFLVDMAATDGRSPTEDFHTLRDELRHYEPGLLNRPYVLVANKMDLPEAAEQLKIFCRENPNSEVIPISGTTAMGLEFLKHTLRRALGALPPKIPTGMLS